jgi:hypothetical protein
MKTLTDYLDEHVIKTIGLKVECQDPAKLD